MTDDVVLDIPSTEEKAQHYKAMGDSVTLIHSTQTTALPLAGILMFWIFRQTLESGA